MSTLIRGWTLLQKVKIKVSLEQKQKFSSTFYKRWQITKTASLFALRRVRNSRVEFVQLLSSGAFAVEFFNTTFVLKKRGIL